MHIRKNWIYLDWRKYLYIDIQNPFREMKKLKRVFKPLECYFKCSSKSHSPVLWCSTPAWIHIMSHSVGWKDKYETPRYEVPPYIWIHLFGLNLIWYWDLPIHLYKETDDYWEQALWYLYYYDTYSQGLLDTPDINKARESWPWQEYKTKQSSWSDKFLVK